MSLTLLLLVTIVLTWPLVASLDSHVAGHVGHPGLQGDYFFQWNVLRQMEKGHVDVLFSREVRYPEGQEIRSKVAFSLHLGVYMLMMLVFDLATARNLTVLLVLFSNAVAAWYLFRKRVDCHVFALAAAFVFAFGPYVYLKLDQGFLQKAILFHLPLFILFFLRLIEKPRLRDGILCAIVLIVSLLVYPPYAVFNLAFAGILLAGVVLRRHASRRLLLSLAVIALLLAPFLVLVWNLGRGDFLFARPMPLAVQAFHTQGGYLDLLSPFRCFPYLGTFSGSPFQAFVEALPIGLPVVPLLLCVVAVVGRRRYARGLLLLAIGITVVMAGPYLMHRGELVSIGGEPVSLPFLVLAKLPFGNVLRMPIRLFPWLDLALLLAAGEGYMWLRNRISEGTRTRRLARAFPLLVAIVLVLEPRLVFPEYGRFNIEHVPRPQYCLEEDVGSAILHLPYLAPGIHEYQFQAVLCDCAIVNPIKRRPPPLEIPPPGTSTVEKQRFLSVLSAHGIRRIVVHPAAYRQLEEHPYAHEPSLGRGDEGWTGHDVEAWLEAHLGPPVTYPEDGVRVYSIPDGM